MKNYTFKILTALVGGLFLLTSCQDLDVTNPNNPDTERALASAADVEALVGSQYQQWWNTQKNYPGMTLSVMANASTASWGNFGMFDLGAFPRQAFLNDPSYADIGMSTVIWSNAYTAISSVNDGLNALEAGITFDSQNEMRQQRMETFARFIQGISYGLLANHYDQGFIIDETTDLEGVALGNVELEMVDYQQVLDAAVGFLDDAIALANSSSFTLPAGWIAGNALTSDELALLAEAYKVRFITSNARSVAERDAIDWTAIRDMTGNVMDAPFFDNSEDAFTVEADGVFWWSRPHSLQQDPGWVRTDMMLIGRTDESGQFDAYANGPVTDREQFILTTSDRRIAGQEDVFNEENDLVGEAKRTARGTDFAHAGPAPHPSARGEWRWSRYHHHRNSEMYANGFVGPMQHMRVTEMKMLRAEALLRLNEPVILPEVVELINETRVDRGGLDPMLVTDGFGDVWNAMRYEFEIETHATAAGLDYYHTRSWGNLRGESYGKLLEGTPIHFPVPAGELMLLEMPIYTFGGSEGGAAPKGIPSDYMEAIKIGNQMDVTVE
jgi:starch-binding outer membrane protein, SusD/RagB family